MSCARRLITRLLVSSVTLLGAISSARGAAIVDPALHFRTLATEHFIIYFHQGEERLAIRLAPIAEDVWGRMAVPLGVTPPALTHVALVDQTELANGLATPLPYNTIFIFAAWPSGAEYIGKTDDWLRLVFTHEFAHVVHLDRSVGWAKAVRAIFGRVPLAFPNLFLPRWHVEGLATYEESAMTGGGRLYAGDFRAIVTEAAATSHLEPLDRVNGGLTAWPSGNGPYAYGVGFHEYLAERFGTESFARLARSTAGRVPYTASRVFEGVYGHSLGTLWRDYESHLAQRSSSTTNVGDEEARSPGVVTARRLTHHGFEVSGPRFDKARCDGCQVDIVYSVRTPNEFPALYRLSRDDMGPRRLTTRYQGNTTAIGTDAIYFDQQEIRRNVGIYSDLYSLDRQSGRVVQMTSEARLLDPDLAPDGKTLVAVHETPGRRDLVLVQLSDRVTRQGTGATKAFRPSITTLLSEPDTQFNTPRWSPDGRTIAVERHAIGHRSEIAVVAVATRTVRTIASDSDARFVTPTWRPDGRAVVAAADFNEGPFELYEIPVDPAGSFGASESRVSARSIRRLTHTSGGATWPDISADGRTIVFVGYTTDGLDLFEMPYPDTKNADEIVLPSATQRPRISPLGDADIARQAEVGSKSDTPGRAQTPRTPKYNPLATLVPTSWSPFFEGTADQLRLGIATAGRDVLGYHGFTVSATWLVTSPSRAISPPASPDWQVSYQYSRWRPTFWVSASADTSFFAGPADERGVPSTATSRERLLQAGVLLPIRHVRTSNTALFSAVRGEEELNSVDGAISRTRTAARAGWGFDSSHLYGYSISREGGVAIGATTEVAPQALGSSDDASAVTVDGRIYAPGLAPHHVLAIRIAGGRSTGDPTVRRTFLLGGGQSNPSTLDFGRDAISLLRGFARDTFAGSHVALLNVDYRLPLARPQRGHGTWPFFLHTVHSAGFADIGHAWDRQFDAHDLKTSVGGELSFDLFLGYSFPLTTTVGGAWGWDGSGVAHGGASLYVRLGRAF
jgi:Tol biopolymer transport system component